MLSDSYMSELERGISEAWDIGQRLGFDPFPIHYEILPATQLYEIAGYGMPTRFSHWSHGKAFAREKIYYDYGMSKIFELIINTNPCQAFLLEHNDVLTNKFIAAHCIGHSDFFKNNAWFAETNRHMTETMSVHADRIRQYEYDYGMRPVESFIDAVLSIDIHVDKSVASEDLYTPAQYHPMPKPGEYDDLWKRKDDPEKQRVTLEKKRTPSKPVPDLLYFIAHFSPILEDWQRDILMMLRQESIYFQPQMKTKVANEGWAVYSHTRIMREMNLTDSEYTDFARLHASVVNHRPGSFNPYYLGFVILESIEEESGTEAVFQARETQNDASLIRNYLTEDIVRDMDLFTYQRFGNELVVTDKDWEVVRDRLANQFATHGIPRMVVIDGDWGGNMELMIRHEWDGMPLDMPYAEKTMEYLHQLWGRKVWLQTWDKDGKEKLLSYNNNIHTVENNTGGSSTSEMVPTMT